MTEEELKKLRKANNDDINYLISLWEESKTDIQVYFELLVESETEEDKMFYKNMHSIEIGKLTRVCRILRHYVNKL